MRLKINNLLKIAPFDIAYFFKGGSWVSAAQAFTMLGGFLSTVVLANTFTETEYGLYKYSLTLLAIFGAISFTGLPSAIMQITAKGWNDFYKETLWLRILTSLPGSVLALIFSGYYYLNENVFLSSVCIVIALLVPFLNALQGQLPWLHGMKRFQTAARCVLLHTLVITTLTATTAYTTKDPLSTFGAFLLSTFFVLLTTHALLTRTYIKNNSTDHAQHSKYLSYAKHTSVRNTAALVSSKLDSFALFTMLGSQNLAVYAIATLFPEYLKGLLRNLFSLLIPKYVEQKDVTQTVRSIPHRSVQTFTFICLISVAYCFIAPSAVTLLFPNYTEAILYSQILALSLPTTTLFIPYNFLKSQMSEKPLYQITISSVMTQSVLVLTLTSLHGTIGTVFAILIYRYIFMSIVFLTFFKVRKSYL